MEAKSFGSKKITIRFLSKKDLKTPRKFQKFINSLIAEDAQILETEKKSLKEESDWLKNQLGAVRKRTSVFLVAEDGDLLAGSASVNLGRGRQSHIGTLGISIIKEYRGMGLGNYLINKALESAKKNLKPSLKIIKLGVLPTNEPAKNLYRKIGFKEVAILPKHIEYKGKLIDEMIMIIDLAE